MRRKMWKVWQIWLKASIPINLISWVFFACCLDGKSIVPAVICTVNALWILLLAIANNPERNNKKRGYEYEIRVEESYLKELQRG